MELFYFVTQCWKHLLPTVSQRIKPLVASHSHVALKIMRIAVAFLTDQMRSTHLGEIYYLDRLQALKMLFVFQRLTRPALFLTRSISQPEMDLNVTVCEHITACGLQGTHRWTISFKGIHFREIASHPQITPPRCRCTRSGFAYAQTIFS